MSIAFSALVGVSSSFATTHASFTDAEAVAGSSITMDCWRDFSKDGVKKREYHSCTNPHEKHDDHDNSGGVNTESVDETQVSDFAVVKDAPASPSLPAPQLAVEPQPATHAEQPATVVPHEPTLQEQAPPVGEAPVAEAPVSQLPVAEEPAVEQPAESAPAAEQKTDNEGETASQQGTADETSSETAP